MGNRTDASRNHVQLIIGLCLFVFFNISCFTVITSFTKSNFLTAIQTTPAFQEGFNQRPYFFLYGFAGVGFVLFYFLYHVLNPKVSFEYRIKRDIRFLIGCSLVLYLVPLVLPGFQKKFFPASFYFVVYDILDDFIIVQTWTLINYCIDIRESRRIQSLFLFSGGTAAFLSGRLVVPAISADNPLGFLLLTMAISCISYVIVFFIFAKHRSGILSTASGERVGFTALFASQKKYRIIRSIIYLTILIGIFNLFFKVLFDTQVNARFPANSAAEIAALDSADKPDPKTEFIGDYKAIISMLQVVLQLGFIYFFTRLWFNGRILFAYPLLLIPNLLFVLGVFFIRGDGFESLLFWGTILACGINELVRRIIFDAAFQVLMFSVPERLCNALRLYSKLLIKPVVVILICIFFVVLPPQEGALALYCFLIMVFLAILAAVVVRIPEHYISSLKTSVLRRLPLSGAESSLVRMEVNYIVDQYEKVVSGTRDRFEYLYILDIIRNNHSSSLNYILLELLENEDQDVKLETVSVIGSLGIPSLVPRLETLFEAETDETLKLACLKVISRLGSSNENVILGWVDQVHPIFFRRYFLLIAYRTENEDLRRSVVQEATSLIESARTEDALAGIWLAGHLGLHPLKEHIRKHFGMDPAQSFYVILRALARLGDAHLFVQYLELVGYDRIRDFEKFNETLAFLQEASFPVISRMINTIIRSKSHFDARKCLRSLRAIKTPGAITFMLGMLEELNVPNIRQEILNVFSKIRKDAPELDSSGLLEHLPKEINLCTRYCRYYSVVKSWNPESLLLIELARNIEHRLWCVFKIFDMFYPDLRVFDSYYRITRTTLGNIDHVKGKSIEYLDSLAKGGKDQHAAFLRLLDAVSFENGFLSDVGYLPGPHLSVEDVYEQILLQSNRWLEISAILDVPPEMQQRFMPVLEEIEDMIPVLEKIHFLRRVSLFKGFSITDMIILAQIAREVSFEAGHVLFKVGDPGDALYLVLEGKVDIVNENEKLMVSVGPPGCFGEIAILDKKGRSATARCVEECRMLMITNRDFEEILEEYPALYKNIVYLLTSWLREDMTRAKEAKKDGA
ncbi:cyclic nucleotide-binding domain protein [delta proteobacterium NaphS2]|nr:cyclic nucleotide-binding domain protein [delta proteobacterium NaphS2]